MNELEAIKAVLKFRYLVGKPFAEEFPRYTIESLSYEPFINNRGLVEYNVICHTQDNGRMFLFTYCRKNGIPYP